MTYNDLDFVGQILYKMLSENGSNAATAIKDVLVLNPVQDPATFGILNTLYELVLPAGLMMMVVYYLSSLSEESVSGRDFSLEKFLFGLLKVILAMIIVSNGTKVIDFAISFGNSFVDLIWSGFGLGIANPGTATTAITENTDLIEAIDEMGVMGQIVVILPALIIWLLRIVANSLLKLQAYTRLFELIFRVVIFPLGVADLISDGMRSSGVRYVKKLLAAFVNGSVMLLAVLVMGTVSLDIIVGNVSGSTNIGADVIGFIASMFDGLLIPFAAVGAMGLAKTVVNDAFGV